MKVGEWYIAATYDIPAFLTLDDLKNLSSKFYINVGEKFLILENLEELIGECDFMIITENNTAFKILYNGKVCYGWFVKENSRYSLDYAQYKISKL